MIFKPLVATALVLAACDPGPSAPGWSEPVAPRNGQVPELAPPIVCEPGIEPLESLGELPVSWLTVEPPSLRGFLRVAPIDSGRTLAIGTYGDWFPEGLFVLAYDDGGSPAWETLLPVSDEVTGPLVEPTASDDAWLVARGPQATTVWRLAADGSQLVGAMTIAGVSTLSIRPTPSDGLLLVGVAPDGLPAFAELSAAGAVLWQGPANLAAFDHASASGLVQRWDDAGALVWEHDPRPVPHAGFPLDIGATWARVTPSGDVVAHGSEVALGGDAMRLLGLEPDGQPKWSVLRPYASVRGTQLLAGGQLLVTGIASECGYAGWFLLVDDAGNPMAEGRNAVIGVDAQRRLVTLPGYDDTGITFNWVAEVPA